MILSGSKKRVLKEVVKYYVSTTGSEYEEFILGIQKHRGNSATCEDYPSWLANECYKVLHKNDISIADIIENKDTVHSAIKEDKSRMEGEFYTPEIWCKEGREYLKNMLGDLWGEAYIWDGSCGAANLLKTANYPADKVFLSTLLEEDVKIVKGIMPDSEVFQCDFVNGLDIDENNKSFSDKLPKKLIEVLENNKPLVFYMNPPYKTMIAASSDVGVYMGEVGMNKCALDIFHQFMYRILMLKRFYNHTNMYCGIFGPVTMFHSDMLKPLYDDFKSEFVFEGGMCFNSGDFANTSESVGWIVGYTTWRTKVEGDEDKPLLLDVKSSEDGENVTLKGQRLITGVKEDLHDWVKPKDIIRYDMLPCVTNLFNFNGKLVKHPHDALGGLMSARYGLRAVRRTCVTSLPNPDNIPVVEENFWRCVASFGARRAYSVDTNPYNSCQYISKPDTSIEGYEEWLRDGLILFLFEYSALNCAYRDLQVESEVLSFPNKFFPLSYDEVKEIVTDEEVIKDMESNFGDNAFILEKLNEALPYLSEEARDVYDFAIDYIKKSLTDGSRSEHNYSNWTKAWDAGLVQLRSATGTFPKDIEDKYLYLLSKLKNKMLFGVYKFGFLMNYEDGVK